MTKLNIIEKHFENINSPRFTEEAILTNNTVYPIANNIKQQILYNRRFNNTIANFSEENPSHSPINDKDPKIFHDYLYK